MSQVQLISETVESSFPFTIDKFPLSGPDGLKSSSYGLWRSDNGEEVARPVSRDYTPHTKDDVKALCEAAASSFDGDVQVRCNWHCGHYVTVSPTDAYRRSIYGDDDNVWPRLIISAPYGGKAFRTSLGWYRDACQNLAMLRSVGSFTETIIHRRSLREKMDQLVTKCNAVAGNWEHAVETLQRMEATEVNLREFLTEMYPQDETASQRTRKAADRRIEAIFRRVTTERMRTGRPDVKRDWMVSAWEAYNAVQGYTQHDKTRKGKINRFDRAILSMEDSTVNNAERYLLNLAS